MAGNVPTLDADSLQHMIKSAAERLGQRRGQVDALNVFPVPDGDTGHNMGLTMEAAAAAIAAAGTGRQAAGIGPLMQTIAQGSLRGARGNSGVILSQIFRGMAAAWRDVDDVGPGGVAEALRGASDTAYKMVMRPVEGTILTVAKAAAGGAESAVQGGAVCCRAVLESAVDAARRALALTPEQLPVLKQAGVVDAGGQGLVYVLEGFVEALGGAIPEPAAEPQPQPQPEPAAARSGPSDTGRPVAFQVTDEIAHIEFPYDVELFVQVAGSDLDTAAARLLSQLDDLGDSIMVIPAAGLLKVHVHTDRPGAVLDRCTALGELSQIHIENMRLQFQALDAGTADVVPGFSPEWAVVAVSPGPGFSDVYRSLGAAQIVSGGQTMNPSAQEILEAVNRCRSAGVILLPNNPNVIMACEQVKDLTDIEIAVVATRSEPQGVAALLAILPGADLAENFSRMAGAAESIRSGSVTHAVRDGRFDDLEIRCGDALGLVEGQVVVTTKTAPEALLAVLDREVGETTELITVYYGEGMTSERLAELETALMERYSDCDIEILAGGQKHYDFVFSLE
ncbi:MAG: DAK2 domain-containing protein [Thermaerobacterales bacterium]